TDAAAQLTSEEKILLKRRLLALRRNGLPPIVTHNVENDQKDQVLNEIRRLQLFNCSSDRVKVIFHPEFLNQASPLFGMDYEDFVRGCHLGVFPSYYEPWWGSGITTNLSGFGCYMKDILPHPHEHGIYIVDRRMKSVEESCNQLTDFMFEFVNQTRRERITQRNRTERLSDLLDWKRMGKEYRTARKVAMKRKWPHLFQRSPTSSEEDLAGDDGHREVQKIARPRSAVFREKGEGLPFEDDDLGGEFSGADAAAAAAPAPGAASRRPQPPPRDDRAEAVAGVLQKMAISKP
ncbi:MAG: glycogen synthase-domain-containing protein, partial [Olpidium bornovanus]